MKTPNNTTAGTPDLDQLVEGFALGHFATNCYLLRAASTGACWVVDASWGAGAIADRINELGLRPERLILTHAHPDHIAGIPDLRAAFPGLPVAIHRAEKDWLTDPSKNLSSALGDDPIALEPPDEVLEHDQTLTLGEHRWRVLHTPGHSPGGIGLYSEELGVLVAGDTLFAGSIGRYDFPSSDGPTLFASIRDTLYALPDETVVLPGHGPATTIGREKSSNPFVRPERD